MTIRYSTGAAALLCAVLLSGAAYAVEGEVKIVLPEQPANLDPCRSIRSDIGRIINSNITETLTVIEPEKGTVAPWLADKWERVNDLTWRVHLKSGVKFQDGAEFNADAVVKSINRLMNPKLTCDSRSKFGDVKLTPKAVDAQTVEIVSDSPVPIMPTLLGTVQIVSPNMPFDKESNKPVGTGPYVVESASTEEIVLKRDDGYWGAKPDVTRATYVWRNESAIRAAMIESAEADLTPSIAVQDATNPQTDFAYLNSETTRMRIDAQIPPLDDVRIRKALNMAIDWDGMGEALFGKDVLRASQMVVPGVRGHNPDIKAWTYNPDEAKKLVEEAKAAGAPVDKEIVLIGRNGFFPNSSESLEAMRSMWQEIGLNVSIRQLEAADWVRYLDKPFPEGRGPTLFQQQHDNNTGDAGFTAPVMYLSDGQYSTIADKDLDARLKKAMAATGDDREKLFQSVFAKVHDEIVADVPMYHMIGYVRVGPRLDWKPDLKTNSEIALSEIHFKN
ncbi:MULTISPECIES: ABC transporter substrate-binding protein [Rhizobium]|uniref:Periplasmic dipeptide transport protein Dipeptide-binding protein n=1 Tax=Rhizobium favelukesii TaxID=348824 RepID=W6S3X5_9HYPH|nr:MULTISPECIES: ABC transporter substrate-binding protein [Rhizobium]MCS0460657.1 ABC transporter substrate-binding protein [Rhizobium favelukesii]UFS85678.1 ABC transporter substrate-binding protein [Rhizobium sp. T136]CDM61031.1 Periplasmic dipeptide transport protein Dipeptide-binding protein [Rhizobium favelukesii]